MSLSPPARIQALSRSIADCILADGAYKLQTHPRESRPLTGRDFDEDPSLIYSVSGYHYGAMRRPEIADRLLEVVLSYLGAFEGGWLGYPSMARSYAMFLRTGAAAGRG